MCMEKCAYMPAAYAYSYKAQPVLSYHAEVVKVMEMNTHRTRG